MGNVISQNQQGINYSVNKNENNKVNNHHSNNQSQANPDKIIHPLLSHTNSKTTASVIMTSNNMTYNDSLQDVSMSGTSSADLQHRGQPPVQRKKSTMILTDESELDQNFNNAKPFPHQPLITHDQPEHNNQPGMESPTNTVDGHNHHPQLNHGDTSNFSTGQYHQPEIINKLPVEISWLQGGQSVFITGSFTGWRKMIKLNKDQEQKFTIKLKLPIGTHRFRFIVDNELRFSDYLPTATDQMGNFVNYIEISLPPVTNTTPEDEQSEQRVTNGENASKHRYQDTGSTSFQNQANDGEVDLKDVDDDDMGNGYSRFHEEQDAFKERYSYNRDIPKIFVDPTVMEQYYNTVDNGSGQQQSWLVPPQLPPHLENVILNNFQTNDKNNNSGALPIPNHVVLNHLATTSIKHNTLAVASVVRYKRKYVTQVLYAPLQ